MDKLKPIQDNSVESSTPDIKCIERDIYYTRGTLTETSLHIKFKNINSIDGISCDPYNIEENIDLIDVHKEFKISIKKEDKFVTSETVDYVSQIASATSSKIDNNIENKNNVNHKKDLNNNDSATDKKDSKIYWMKERTQLLSTEKAAELLKAVIDLCKKDGKFYNSDNVIWRKDDPNVCSILKFESNSVKERIEHLKSEKHQTGFELSSIQNKNDPYLCCVCGFYSETVHEQLEHLNGSWHIGAEKIKEAIICGILENYTINTFYCTVCSWFVTDFQPLIKHILSIRHNNALLVSKYIKNQIIHINADNKGKVYCSLCKCMLTSESDIDEIYNHVKNHREKCYHFNYRENGCHNSQESCEWYHECVLCGDEHPQIKCYLKKILGISVVDGNENFSPVGSKTHNEVNAIVAMAENSNKEMCRENSHNSSIPCKYSESEKEYIFKRLSSHLKNDYKHEIEYNSKSSKNISKIVLKNVEDKTSYSSETDIDKYGSYQRRDRSRSPARRYRSISPSDRRCDNIILNSKSPIRSDLIKEHSSISPFKQPSFAGRKQITFSNSSICFSDVDSDDEDEGFNIITTIVKLLRICNLLGNLGYFFAVTLNKALKIKDSRYDVLNLLREPANIILMEVIFKKLKTFEKSVYDRRVRKKVIKGIMYLTYLIDVSKSSHLCNSSQNSIFMLDSSPLPSVRSSTNKSVVSHSSVASPDVLVLSLHSASSKNINLCHGLNVQEIAKATSGRNIEYIVYFIKSSLKFIGRNPTQDTVGDIALAVSNEHFRMLSNT